MFLARNNSTALKWVCVIILALTCPMSSAFPVIDIPIGAPLNLQPGADILHPTKLVQDISITLTPATIKGEGLIEFTSPVFLNDATGTVNLFAPTLRLKAGSPCEFSVTLTNNLTQDGTPDMQHHQGFYGPGDTNLHLHGLHASPGVGSQLFSEAYGGGFPYTAYTGGDNVFLTIPAVGNNNTAPVTVNFTHTLPSYHLPGLHWFHPHKHGSGTNQAFTANGLIIVEDDPMWLPDVNGCSELRTLLETAPEVIMHFGVLTFAPGYSSSLFAATIFRNNIPRGTAEQGILNLALQDTSLQDYSALTQPTNPLCCNEVDVGTERLQQRVDGALNAEKPVLTGLMSNTDFLLLNGGYQPTLTLQSGQFQRWRTVHTGWKRFLNLQILDAGTNVASSACEMWLVAKDGVYLLTAPRAVDHIFLSAANRADVLVRCTAPPGSTFILSAGASPSPIGPGFQFTQNFGDQLIQPIVATLTIEARPEGLPPLLSLTEGACTPLRPPYAADLRDEALIAANAQGKAFFQQVGFGGSTTQTFGCLINVSGVLQNFSYPDPAPIVMPLGSIVEWNFTWTNNHPLHLHVNPFQPGDFHDTLQLPMMAAADAAVKLRIQPGEFAGYAVLHCHFLHHEDMGCMKVVKWECDPGDDQPEVCESFTYPVPGTLPTV